MPNLLDRGQHTEFDITVGLPQAGIAAVYKLEGYPGTLFGLVENRGPADFTFKVQESTDNDVADKYLATVATGTITLADQPADGNIITIDDGIVVAPVVFEFDSGGGVTGGRTAVTIGGTVALTLAALKTAINGSTLAIDATDLVVGTSLTLTHQVAALADNETITKTGANIAVTGMTGGQDDQNVSLHYNGADVASITVVPDGRAIFALDTTGLSNKYLLLRFTPTADAYGKVSLFNWFGGLVSRARTGEP